MADIVFNISKGKVNEYHDRVDTNDPANSAIIVVLLTVAEADATLRDYDTLAALLAGANTECDFTNYARKTISDAATSPSAVDDTNDRREAALPDQTWTAAGGALNNTLVKLLVCYDPDTTAGTDSTLVPLTKHDRAWTPDGNTAVLQFATGSYTAS